MTQGGWGVEYECVWKSEKSNWNWNGCHLAHFKGEKTDRQIESVQWCSRIFGNIVPLQDPKLVLCVTGLFTTKECAKQNHQQLRFRTEHWTCMTLYMVVLTWLLQYRSRMWTFYKSNYALRFSLEPLLTNRPGQQMKIIFYKSKHCLFQSFNTVRGNQRGGERERVYVGA